MSFGKPGSGDFWGGLAAMLVALPSAVAFGVAIYSTLGGTYAAQGALAGILGAMALGLVASALGGAQRLISAPCAPAAAVLTGFAIEALHGGSAAETVLLLLTVIGLGAGVIQVIFGTVGLGRLIKYMPYPVVSGYLSGVGLYIIASQVPKFLGMPKGSHFWESLATPGEWHWQAMLVGVVTMVVMLGAGRITKAVPAAILGLVGGVLTYFAAGLADPTLWSLTGNAFVVGPVKSEGGGFVEAFASRWQALSTLDMALLRDLLVPALTLAVLLSIDTLKTCVVLDALTHSRHDSNRELIGQGIGNISSAVIGGMPGAGTMGATLVSISSGGSSRWAGLIEGGLSLFAFLVLGALIAWVPVAALAGILLVVGGRMIDLHSLHFLKSRSTILDFAVIAAVVVTALTVSLIAASGVGILLAVVLFVREQIGGNIVRRKALGNQSFSKQIRIEEEMKILERDGDKAVIFELQGSLFFGTADQLYSAIEPELKRRKYVILDMRRVQTVDITAAHVLDLVKDILAEQRGFLIFSDIPKILPSGKDVQRYFDEVGLVQEHSPVRVFDELDDAIEWVEDRILADAALDHAEEKPLELAEFGFFKGRKEHTLAALEARMEKRSAKAGEKIFASGDTGDELFLIRRGEIRILLPLPGGQSRHLSTFGQGNFFGEMAFLDGAARSADALAFTDTDLYVLPRASFDSVADEHKKAALGLLESVASTLAARLRYANAEMRALEE